MYTVHQPVSRPIRELLLLSKPIRIGWYTEWHQNGQICFNVKSEQVEALIFRLCCPGGPVSGQQGLTSNWHLDSFSFYLGALEYKRNPLQPDQHVRNCQQLRAMYYEGSSKKVFGFYQYPHLNLRLFETIIGNKIQYLKHSYFFIS